MKNEARRIGVPVIDVDTLTRNWWVVLLRGIAGVSFGVATMFAPEISLLVLVLMFGAYALGDGILALVTAMRRAGDDRWWVLLLQGLAGIGAGVATLLWPGITALVLLYLIAGWALVTGGFELAAAIRLRKVIEREWLLALSGIASIVLGVVLMLAPGPGALALVLWIGACALVSGTLLMVLAFRLRSYGRTHGAHPRGASPAYA